MALFSIANTRIVQILVVLFLSVSLTAPLMPTLVHAQGTTPTTPATQTAQKNSGWCEGWLKDANPVCWIRGISVGLSMGVIYIAGMILRIAGAFMNGMLALTTVDFNTSVYTYVAPGIEAVWTVFRDIANIIIIGMFTFIALSMILGIEKFNARQMVAKVLLIAVLINFSLLFTRVIIESSNFFAIQFYKAASIGVDPGTGNAAAVGISGKFGQIMGVYSVVETSDALWKAELGWWDPGIMTMALAGLVVIVTLVAALMFFYIAFLLVARTLLFIFLLITSSLAFASYLLPGEGVGGYGWSTWWSSLLKNAVFAPLLLMFLWATIQVGANIKQIAGAGTIGGLLANPTQSGNINALFCYLLIIGMLYVSIKVSSSFSHKIGGFNYAALLPAYGAGIAGRLGGFLTRQTLGRGAMRLGEKFQANSADQNRNRFVRDLYDFSSKQMKGVAKRDFNLARGRLGAEIQGAAGIKSLDAMAGKQVKGFEGSEKARAEAYAEKAGRMKMDETTLKNKRSEEVEKIANSDSGLGKERKEAQAIRSESEKALQQLETAQKKMADKFDALSKGLASAEADAVRSGRNPSGDSRVQRLAAESARHESDMRAQATRIERARDHLKNTGMSIETIEKKIEEQASAKYKDAPALAKDLAHNRFTNVLHRVTGLSTPKNDKLAKLAEKAVGDKGKKQRLKDWATAINDGHEPPKTAGPGAPADKPH